MTKKLLALLLALVLCLSLLVGCGSSGKDAEEPANDGAEEPAADAAEESDADEADEPAETAETVVLNVAASSVPHAQILEQVVDTLAEQGIDLQIHEYGDYVVPNTAVEEGAEDVNFFQHLPYLENFNAENGTHLVSVAGIHIEPMGIYAGNTASLEELTDGASVALPNDVTNEARALILLQSQGLITLAEDVGFEATPNDIVDNPLNLTFNEVEAAMVPNILSEVDIAVINVNYALESGFNPVEDSLAIESSDSPWVNVLVVKEGNEDNAAVQALIEAIETDAVRDFILDSYDGSVVPVF